MCSVFLLTYPSFDFRKNTLCVKEKTRSEIKTKIEKLLSGASPLQFQSVAGSLAFASSVGLVGRTYCYHINRKLAALQDTYGHHFPEEGVLPLEPEVLDELSYWQKIDENPKFDFDNSKQVNLPFKVYTDASNKFFGIKLGQKQIRGDIPPVLALEPIQVKEAFAVRYYIVEHSPANTRINLLTDNKALFHNFQKRSSRNELVNQYLREIFVVLRERKSALDMAWISTELMLEEGADQLSRDFVEKFFDEKGLSELGAAKILNISGLDTNRAIDVFASSANNPFNIQYAHINWDLEDKKALGKDGFEFLDGLYGKLVGFHLFVYPPLALMDVALEKLADLSLSSKGKLIVLVTDSKAVKARLLLARLGQVTLVPFCRRGNRHVLLSKASLGLTLLLVSKSRKRKIE